MEKRDSLPGENDVDSYREYFKEHGKNWEMDLSKSHDLRRVLPVTGEFARQNLLYLESMTVNLNTPDGFYMRRKDYDSFQVCYTTQGHGRLVYDGKEYDFYPGDCFFIDCRKEHYYYTVGPGDWVHHGLQLRGYQLGELFEWFYDQHSVKVSLGVSEKVFVLFMEIAEACNAERVNNELLLNLLLWELLTKIISCDQIVSRVQLPKRLANVCRYIEREFAGIRSIDEIAEACYMSKFYLCREFKKCMGQTVVEYLTAVRLNRAKLLLSASDLPVEEIAYEVGYTPNYFFSIFKKMEGVTPLKYRKNNKG